MSEKSKYQDIIHDFYGPLTSADGVGKADMVANEKRMGVKMPKLLRDYYLLAGDLKALNLADNQILPLEDLDAEGGVIIFYVDSAQEVSWGFLKEHAGMIDPPVYMAAGDAESEEQEWYPDHRFLSDFLQTIVYWQTLTGGLAHHGMAEIDGKKIEVIQSSWSSVEIGENPWELSLFIREGQILCVLDEDEHTTLIAAGKTETELDRIASSLKIKWLES